MKFFVYSWYLLKYFRMSYNLCVFSLQSVCVEQLTLDFEYLINEVIRSDAAWAPQFCSFSDYDVVILEVSMNHKNTPITVRSHNVLSGFACYIC